MLLRDFLILFFNLKENVFTCQLIIVTRGSVSVTYQANIIVMCHVRVSCLIFNSVPIFIKFIQFSPNFCYFCSI